jgi:hypothetical protein
MPSSFMAAPNTSALGIMCGSGVVSTSATASTSKKAAPGIRRCGVRGEASVRWVHHRHAPFLFDRNIQLTCANSARASRSAPEKSLPPRNHEASSTRSGGPSARCGVGGIDGGERRVIHLASHIRGAWRPPAGAGVAGGWLAATHWLAAAARLCDAPGAPRRATHTRPAPTPWCTGCCCTDAGRCAAAAAVER